VCGVVPIRTIESNIKNSHLFMCLWVVKKYNMNMNSPPLWLLGPLVNSSLAGRCRATPLLQLRVHAAHTRHTYTSRPSVSKGRRRRARSVGPPRPARSVRPQARDLLSMAASEAIPLGSPRVMVLRQSGLAALLHRGALLARLLELRHEPCGESLVVVQRRRQSRGRRELVDGRATKDPAAGRGGESIITCVVLRAAGYTHSFHCASISSKVRKRASFRASSARSGSMSALSSWPISNVWRDEGCS
jgi:hypothetical protein